MDVFCVDMATAEVRLGLWRIGKNEDGGRTANGQGRKQTSIQTNKKGNSWFAESPKEPDLGWRKKIPFRRQAAVG